MITLVNGFVVEGDRSEFEQLFVDASAFMLTKPGFLGTHLVRSLREDHQYFNIAHWASREEFEAAINTPEMEEHRTHIRKIAQPTPHPCITVHEASPGVG